MVSQPGNQATITIGPLVDTRCQAEDVAHGQSTIVDDEKGYRIYPARALRRDGHEVQTAAAGPEGIELGTAFDADVLVADWRLPDNFSGLQIADALGAVNPRLRTIMITGYSAKELKTQAGELVFRVLEKPFGIEELRTAIRDAIQS